MALRIALVKRFLCTSTVSSQFSASAAEAAAEAARNKPAPIPSDTLVVSGLNKRTTNEKLHEAFSKFGQADHAKVATDRNSGYSKGYEFSMEQWRRQQKGLEEWIQKYMSLSVDEDFLEGWVIFAEYARPIPTPGQDRPQDANGARNRW